MTRGTLACLLFSACLASFPACGGRTDVELSDKGAAGAISAAGYSAGGAPNGTAGQAFTSGAPSVSGSPSFGGAPSVGGSPNVGGFAGMPNFGGMGGFAGGAGTTNVIIEACVSLAPTACEQCECLTCADQVVGCFSDPGCGAIFGCIQQTGCQGVDCYSNATCRRVINRFGGLTGKAASEVFALGSCGLSSQGMCACN